MALTFKSKHAYTRGVNIKTEDAVSHFQGVAKLAAALQISRAAVYQWGEFVPASRVYQLHILSGMQLPPQTGDAGEQDEAGAAA